MVFGLGCLTKQPSMDSSDRTLTLSFVLINKLEIKPICAWEYLGKEVMLSEGNAKAIELKEETKLLLQNPGDPASVLTAGLASS